MNFYENLSGKSYKSKSFYLLQELAALKLIELKETKQQDFLSIVTQMRKKASSSAPSLEKITEEVESARASRHARK